MSILETSALTRTYGPRRGIETVNLAVGEGTLFGFLGPNGAGKTTTIRVLVGLLRPTAGAAHIFGLDCWTNSESIKHEIGYLPGDVRMQPWLDGRTALRIWGTIRGRNLLPAGRELAERFNLDLSTRVRSMSRGMRQKLGLILALVHKPRLLVLDEPTVTLDPLMQTVVQQILREMAAEGHTVFFSSHTLGEVEQLCDRVAMIRGGRIVADESLAQLRTRAGHQVTIRWRDAEAAAATPPAALTVEKREALTWSGVLDGPIEPFVAWLSGRGVEDLSIGRPDLETLFRHFYVGEGQERRA
ncbi:MAG: ABC transporter ATP-binding protein [Planctomycetota bacterium]|nr:MAG: ABC transporter ATP-binding protein [Planctomycetota bacterium]